MGSNSLSIEVKDHEAMLQAHICPSDQVTRVQEVPVKREYRVRWRSTYEAKKKLKWQRAAVLGTIMWPAK